MNPDRQQPQGYRHQQSGGHQRSGGHQQSESQTHQGQLLHYSKYYSPQQYYLPHLNQHNEYYLHQTPQINYRAPNHQTSYPPSFYQLHPCLEQYPSSGHQHSHYSALQHNRYDPRLSGSSPDKAEIPRDPRLRSTLQQSQQGSSKNNLLPNGNERRPLSTPYRPLKHEQQHSSDSCSSDADEEQQRYFEKSKSIKKCSKDSVLDTPSEIKKWVNARKANYAKCFRLSDDKPAHTSKEQTLEAEMSILENKIRKKIMLIGSEPKDLMKKIKNMDILRRLFLSEKIKAHSELPPNNRKKNSQQGRGIRQLLQVHRAKISRDNQGQEKGSESSDSFAAEVPAMKSDPLSSLQPRNVTNLEPARNSNSQPPRIKNPSLTPQMMIRHLQQKQKEDDEFYSKILDYRTNSLSYRYGLRTVETNFMLQDIFTESSYLLQAIRYIVQNDFLRAPGNQQKYHDLYTN